jgi:hypothetical protein
MSESRYKMCTNCETRKVAFWLSNDDSREQYWRDEAQYYWDEATATKTQTREESATYALAKLLQDDIEVDNLPNLDGCYKDLLVAALSEVDWGEIAEHYIYHVQKDKEESDDDESND